jgi:hypothetical protein
MEVISEMEKGVVVVSGVPMPMPMGGLIVGIREEGGVIGVFSASVSAPGQQDSSWPL